jgi:hypothetical protein
MATWTSHCWPNVIEALNTGQPIRFCFEDQSDVLQGHNSLMIVRQVQAHLHASSHSFVGVLIPSLMLGRA